jgi:hypothetical protein
MSDIELPLTTDDSVKPLSTFVFKLHDQPYRDILHKERSVAAVQDGDVMLLESLVVGQCWVANDGILNAFFPYYVTDNNISGFLHGPVLSVLAWKSGLVPLHASAVGKDGRAILFLGDSGAGKSTMSAGLCTHGWEFITDDVAILCKSDDTLKIVRSSHRAWLLPDSVSNLQVAHDKNAARPDGKCPYDVSINVGSPQSYDLSLALELEFCDIPGPRLMPLPASANLANLVRGSLMAPPTPQAPDAYEKSTDILKMLMNGGYFSKLSRPKKFDQLKLTSDMLEEAVGCSENVNDMLILDR